jgi:Cof subfamily protein (haloacid dehalogenase superfamily)
MDIDGTLINSQGVMTKETVGAIRKCMEAGVMVTISSGRSIQGVRSFIDELELDAPIITYNGAMIVDAVTGRVLFEQGLSGQDAEQVLKLGMEIGTTIIAWSNNELYVNVINDHVMNYWRLSGVKPVVFTDIGHITAQGVTKIIWIDTIDRIEALKEGIKDIVNDSVTYCTSQPHYLEFFDSSVSKAAALEFIGRMYDIRREEMIAIGDGFNDLSMIEYAGLGVAMGNAAGGVKENADYVTASNDEDGIAQVIYKFVFSGKEI